jgi:hypothetical protein
MKRVKFIGSGPLIPRSLPMQRTIVAFFIIAPLYIAFSAHRQPVYVVAVIAAIGFGVGHLVEAAVYAKPEAD